jgi:hypothetical protein
MKVFILSAYPSPHDFVSNWLIASASEDSFGIHTRVDDPDLAELIVFAEGHTAGDPYYFAVRNHPLRRRYPDRCFLYHDEDYVVPLLPGLYPALEVQDRDPGYAVGAPYMARITENPVKGPVPAADAAASVLYSFVGSATTHPVRREIMKLTHDERACCEDTGAARSWALSPEERSVYLSRFFDITAKSKFVLCPRGHSPSTYRLFETMEAGRAPVIVSDAFTPPEGPDWATFSLRVSEADTATIPAFVRRHEHVAAEMGAKARRAWELWFAPAVSFHRTAEVCREIAARRSAAGAGMALRLRYLRKLLAPFHLKMLFRLGKRDGLRFLRGPRSR